MELDAFLDRALDSIAGSYDIERHARVCGREVEALAQLRALNSKYVLSRKHVLWEANAFEHVLFVKAGLLTARQVEDWFSFLTGEAEPELVHPGAPCPPEGHMVSYLTLIFLCDGVQEDAAKAVRRARFSKNYRFSLRGWATGCVLAIDPALGRVTSNGAAREMKKHFERLLCP